MCDRKGFELNTAEEDRVPGLNNLPLSNRIPLETIPGLRRGINCARRPTLQSTGMIGMSVREHDSQGFSASSFPSQSAPQSMRIRPDTIRQLCMRWSVVLTSISPRVPRKVSFIAFSVYGAALGTLTTRSGEFPSASAVYWRWKMAESRWPLCRPFPFGAALFNLLKCAPGQRGAAEFCIFQLPIGINVFVLPLY